MAWWESSEAVSDQPWSGWQNLASGRAWDAEGAEAAAATAAHAATRKLDMRTTFAMR
jgi:hypothetical protein